MPDQPTTRGTATADDWKQLAAEFRRIRRADKPLEATWRSVAVVSGVEPEPVFSEGGSWSVPGHEQEAFIEYAIRASCYLGSSLETGENRGDAWLDYLVKAVQPLDFSSSPESAHVRDDIFRFRITGWIEDVCDVSALACDRLATTAWANERSPKDASSGSVAPYPNALARNLDALRGVCSWSLEELALEIGCEKKTCIDHIKHGVKPRPTMLREYVQVFNAHFSNLGVAVSDLQSSDYRIPSGLIPAKDKSPKPR